MPYAFGSTSIRTIFRFRAGLGVSKPVGRGLVAQPSWLVLLGSGSFEEYRAGRTREGEDMVTGGAGRVSQHGELKHQII